MLDKIAFMETLHSVQEIARTSLTPLSKEEIQTYFKEIELTKEQEEMVYQYLQKPQEEIEQEQEQEGNEQEEDGQTKTVSKEKEVVKGSAHFQMYLDEIEEIKVLDQETEKALYQKLVQGDKTVIPEISSQWLKHVIEIAEEYTSGDMILDDVVQEGNIGLLMGLNELLGCGQLDGLQERLEQCIRESMGAYAEEESGEGDQEHTILGKVSLVHEAIEVLVKEQGSEPTVQQLSAYTRIPEVEVRDILSLVKEVNKQ